MPLIFSSTKKTKSISLKEYHEKWLGTLKTIILPHSASSSADCLLASHVHLLLHHLLSYYDSLDHLATSDPKNLPLLLSSSWRSQMERPFLFLGDFHPYLFVNIVRSLLNEAEDEQEAQENQERGVEECNYMVWKDPSEGLLLKIDEMERGLRLMVPSLVDRIKKSRLEFVKQMVTEWTAREKVVEVFEPMAMAIDESLQVFLDTNRLRRSVISDIVEASNLHQGASFLTSLAEVFAGFHDPHLLHWFKKCKTRIIY